MHVAEAGFQTYVIEEGTRSVNSGQGRATTLRQFKETGVMVVSVDGEEVKRLSVHR